jgi:hypothetical protein
MAITAKRPPRDEGFLDDPKGTKFHEVMVIDGYAHRIHKVAVHRFMMGDVEDPDLYAAEPLWNWQQSEAGKWVMEHSIETPMWMRYIDNLTFGHNYAIIAWLKEQDYTYWCLKWGTK